MEITSSINDDFYNLVKKLPNSQYQLYEDYEFETTTLWLYEYNDLEIRYDQISELRLIINKDIINNIELQFDDKLINLNELYILNRMAWVNKKAISINSEMRLNNVIIYIQEFVVKPFGAKGTDNEYIQLYITYLKENN